MRLLQLLPITVFLTSCMAMRWTHAADWPMLGLDNTRNAVSDERDSPTFWRILGEEGLLNPNEMSENVRWTAALGTVTAGDPIVANGLVWIGTNNFTLSNREKTEDAAVLMCFREADGKLLYKYKSKRHQMGRVFDPYGGAMASTPVVEGDHLWFVSNRHELLCLDVGPIRRGEENPKQLWKRDLVFEFGVSPRASVMNLHHWSSVATYKDRLYVVTGNGVGADYRTVPKPEAPSLICFDKLTGKTVWKDSSPGKNILFGQWSSPLVVEVNGCAQAIVAQGDGWVRSFEARSGEPIWQFDMNRKSWKFSGAHRGKRNYLLATPVFHDNRVYIASGKVWEDFGSNGRLCCIDAAKSGDVSAEIAVGADGRPIPHRREQAVDSSRGEQAVRNPNSGLIWEFSESEEFLDSMHWSMSSVVIKNGLLIAVDIEGLVHCLDAKSGKKHWTYESWDSTCFNSPLIVGEKVYVPFDDQVAIFRLSADPNVAMYGGKPIATTKANMAYSSPTFANGRLYLANRGILAAIGSGQSEPLPTENAVVDKKPRPDAPFVSTPQNVVEEMLRLATVTKEDVVFDLGSGDGRIVISAAKRYGCRAVGYEVDSELVAVSKRDILKQGLQSLATIREQDLFTADLSEATVITVFLYPRLLEKLKPQFSRMKPGSRIISHHFAIPGIRPNKVVTVPSNESSDDHQIMMWRIPFKKE